MPYVSNRQRRWAHSPAGIKALGGKEKVHHWDEATKGKKLPETVKHAAFLNELASICKEAGLEGSLLSLFANIKLKPKLEVKMDAARHAASQMAEPLARWARDPTEVFLA